MIKKYLCLLLICVLLLCVSSPIAFADDGAVPLTGESITVYNWGEYISNGEDDTLDVNEEFTRRTGIEVVYDTFSSNEEMYTKIKNGAAVYDVIIPSDYMIAKLISEGLLAELDYNNIPNAQYINPELSALCAYDPGAKYSVPYTWGRVGILYNQTMVTEPVDSWEILWNVDYQKQILMFDNSRDAFGIAMKMLGKSFNTTDPMDWQQAAQLLKEQKPLVDAYVMDQIFNKMGNNENALAPYYAGDALTIYDDNPDVMFAIPKEGTNIFVDAMCITKTSKNKSAAEKYINFMCSDEIAYANISYIAYSSPQINAAAQHKEDLANDYGDWAVDVTYPDSLEGTEVFLELPEEINLLQNELWLDIRASYDYTKTLIYVCTTIGILITVVVVSKIRKRLKRVVF